MVENVLIKLKGDNTEEKLFPKNFPSMNKLKYLRIEQTRTNLRFDKFDCGDYPMLEEAHYYFNRGAKKKQFFRIKLPAFGLLNNIKSDFKKLNINFGFNGVLSDK